MTDTPRRFSFDRQGRVLPPAPRPRKSATTRKYVTDLTDRILARCYPGEVPAAVIERALRQMAERDGHRIPRRNVP